MSVEKLGTMVSGGQRIQLRIKYAIDRVLGALLLLLLSPILVVVALLVASDRGGSIFFRQERLGRRGRPFSIYKFRTMVPNADALLDESGAPITGNRVTSVGRVLRRWSLDELPQLINIVRGDMCFVGPRPALPENATRYKPEQFARLLVKPGVTGLAQTNGRNSLPWSARIELDIEYIESFSLMLDLRILLRTMTVWVRGEGIAPDRNPEMDDLGRS